MFGPEIIIVSTNAYLAQYEPLTLLLVCVALSTALYLVFPRVNYAVMTLLLSLVLTELFRKYQHEYDTMDDNTRLWYSIVSSSITLLFTLSLMKSIF
jgi:hypothetical protein